MASTVNRARRSGRRARGGPRRPRQQPKPSYYIQHTDRDMLFLISNEGGHEDSYGTPSKRLQRLGETPQADIPAALTSDPGWGSLLPLEILHRVFQLVVGTEGAVPTLCRLSRVCRWWCHAASSPCLWHSVSLGFCWVPPGKKNPPSTQAKVRQTVERLIQDRLSLLSEFSLHHWKEQVPFVVKVMKSVGVLGLSLTSSRRECPLKHVTTL
ncbi:F-box/LRR-repeat protein 6-like isoform X2 [Ascaphus truei]|uniref:F-box/LRR-repeat protein 6-like isoform X2 n=1 Tax=Ascaphus truei TaxID=8439 RepID=UPI003F5ACC7A